MTQLKTVKVVIITGYLGSGKTTLLNHILSNDLGIRAAVIVNDIGEVNIDADLVARNGGMAQTDDVISMTNGCICCTLAEDLAQQLQEIAESGDFEYIFIEASGICEPAPIAYTISAVTEEVLQSEADGEDAFSAVLQLDNVVAVVDCARMLQEFHGGQDLLEEDLDEDDIVNLLINQIEFCSTILLNKADLVSVEEMAELRAIVRSLQQSAVMIETTNSNVDLVEILNTDRFDFEKVMGSATWSDAMDHPERYECTCHEHEHQHEHQHGHGHHHHGCCCHQHENPEILEYGISTFVYRRRRPFIYQKFAEFAREWPDSIIRAKGIFWMEDRYDECFIFEQAGQQFYMTEGGNFVAAEPEEQQALVKEQYPQVMNDWDPEVGDRQVKLVFIGRDMDREAITAQLDACLAYPHPVKKSL